MAGDVPKKILWIFIFLILAAIAILGVLFIRGYQSGRHVAQVEASPTPESSETTQPAQSLTLTLDSPNIDVATTSAKLAVSGKTLADAIVSVIGTPDEAMTQALKDGSFSTTVTLQEGLNRLRITAITEDGDEKAMTRNVVYTKGTL